MNIFSKKQKIKFGLFLIAVIIGIFAIWYSGDLVKKLSHEERKKVELWAETVREIQEIPFDGQISPTLYKILKDNNTIPVILVNNSGNVLTHRNLNPNKVKNESYLKHKIEVMNKQHKPIVIQFMEGRKNYVYYEESVLLTNLFYYPFIQIAVVILFIFVSYLAFRSARRADENQVWVGMSKETAHQLGTPISSLMAWIEMMKMKDEDSMLINEVQKDVKRLETITERFSRIGSKPVLVKSNINKILEDAVTYLKIRTSRRVIYKLRFNLNEEILIPLNKALFEWVIENICKNAIDAMSGKGIIIISLIEKKDTVEIDIKDTGKGIPKNKQRAVFSPGFSTKKRGWGLGLSLAKRIIEVYHSGKIFVKNSETNKGTTFRIILKKNGSTKLFMHKKDEKML